MVSKISEEKAGSKPKRSNAQPGCYGVDEKPQTQSSGKHTSRFDVLLHLRQNGSLNLPYFGLVAFVESPLLNSLGAGQTCLTQNLHVFARGRLTDSKLARNQASANPILYQIAVDLRREVFSRVLKPFENL
jgi:hypothetical protein